MNRSGLVDWEGVIQRSGVVSGWILLILAVLWSYGSVIAGCIRSWILPDYQYGFAVPLFAAALLLARGRMVAPASDDDAWWLSRLWSGKAWGATLLRSRTVWMGAIAGAPVGIALYAVYVAPAEGFLWVGVLVAGLYGAAIGGLVLEVAELARCSTVLRRTSNVETWWAAGFFALWAGLRVFSAVVNMERTEEWSLLPLVAGVAVFVGGFSALRWSWPSIAYLYFISPLPGAVEGQLGPLLQTIGTRASIYLIQATGIPATADGHVIQLPQTRLGVAEACSGIRMLMLFFAICVGAAFVLRCPLWKKIVLVAAAVPIAVFANVMRITVTAILYDLAHRWPTVISERTAQWVFHEGAGLLMMPLALAILWALWSLMEKLVIDELQEGPLSLGDPSADSPKADSR